MTPTTYTTQATNAISTLVADIGTVLFGALPAVLGLVAALIGVFFVYRLIKRSIGAPK